MTGRPEVVSVVIPNWNGARWLPGCLEALRAQAFRDFRVYVVDNGSTDESLEVLRGFPEVQVVRHEENLGFATAMNAGISASSGRYVAALNNDTSADPGWLGALVRAMDAAPEAGSAASRLVDFNRPDLIDSLGDGFLPNGLSFKLGAGERWIGAGGQAPIEILSPCAAASIYRREMLARIGGFDDAFFAYMEDVDLGLRAQLSGYRCLLVPDAVVRHVGSATSGGGASAFGIGLTARNAYRVIVKNTPSPLLPVFLACAFATHVGVAVVGVLTGRPRWLRPHLGAFSRGVGRGVAAIPAAWRERRRLSPHRKLGSIAFVRRLVAGASLPDGLAAPVGGADREV